MRALVILLVLGLLACGGDDDDVDASGLTKDTAAAAVEDVQLADDDLGAGWDSSEVDADPVTTCIGVTVTRALDAALLAESDRRDFERAGDERFESTRVSVRTMALEDPDVVDDVLALFADAGFTDCLGQQLEPSISEGDSELVLQVGDVEVDDAYLSLDGVRSSHLSIPFDAEAPGFQLDAELDLVAVSRGQLLTFVLTIQLRGRVDGEDVARWAALVADRQRIAQPSS